MCLWVRNCFQFIFVLHSFLYTSDYPSAQIRALKRMKTVLVYSLNIVLFSSGCTRRLVDTGSLRAKFYSLYVKIICGSLSNRAVILGQNFRTSEVGDTALFIVSKVGIITYVSVHLNSIPLRRKAKAIIFFDVCTFTADFVPFLQSLYKLRLADTGSLKTRLHKLAVSVDDGQRVDPARSRRLPRGGYSATSEVGDTAMSVFKVAVTLL